MSLEGMWTVDFETAAGVRNGGVVVLTNGRILGGDSAMYYIGQFVAEGSSVQGELQVTRYMGQPGVTAWGDDAQTFKVAFKGVATGSSFDGQISRVGYGSLRIHMTRRAELP